VGSPSADRLHRAAKAADRVALFSATERGLLEREAASRKIHALDSIEVQLVEPGLLDQLESHLEKSLRLELVRNAGSLYVTLPKTTLSGTIDEIRLGSQA
jgi:uncharacterized protein YaeQ